MRDCHKSITIVGGGLAGLTLGIGLRQLGVPVRVYEASAYPRHRVCGGFICGKGQETLCRLGLWDIVEAAGARPVKTTAFYWDGLSGPARSLPQPGWSVPRLALDENLAHELERLGGELLAKTRWNGEFSDGVVRATGRRPQTAAGNSRYLGLKVDARNVALDADLEMHFHRDGYVGLNQLPGDTVNVCALFRNWRPVGGIMERWPEQLSGSDKSVLHARLRNAQYDRDSFCSVAGLSLAPACATSVRECSIGDSITMIAPMTGSGMSMAFESAELAIPPLLEYVRGRLDWSEAQERIAAACDRRFRKRLRWAAWLHSAAFTPFLARGLFCMTRGSALVWRFLFTHTR